MVADLHKCDRFSSPFIPLNGLDVYEQSRSLFGKQAERRGEGTLLTVPQQSPNVHSVFLYQKESRASEGKSKEFHVNLKKEKRTDQGIKKGFYPLSFDS